jgi:colanic acid biosynthesis protein WcaH
MFIPETLYRQIVNMVPIPCVDIIAINSSEKILMVKRINEPAKGLWWFPGGRVIIGETRKETALRKLKQECGLSCEVGKEIGTYDLFLEQAMAPVSHTISTVFQAKVYSDQVSLDSQSSSFRWMTVEDIRKECPQDFILWALDKISV